MRRSTANTRTCRRSSAWHNCVVSLRLLHLVFETEQDLFKELDYVKKDLKGSNLQLLDHISTESVPRRSTNYWNQVYANELPGERPAVEVEQDGGVQELDGRL